MKRFTLLLALGALIAGCDTDGSIPPEPVTYDLVVSSPDPADSIAAFLLSFSESVESVQVGNGRLLLSDDRTVLGLVLENPLLSRTIEVTVVTAGEPTVDLLQVVDGCNVVYPDPSVFTLELTEEEGQ